MEFIETIKFIAEVITSIATAGIVIINLFKFIPSPVKIFFTQTIPFFFKGFTKPDGTKEWFFKGLKLRKEHNETTKNIVKALLPDSEMEDILVLDKKNLIDTISKSGILHTIKRRKL